MLILTKSKLFYIIIIDFILKFFLTFEKYDTILIITDKFFKKIIIIINKNIYIIKK